MTTTSSSVTLRPLSEGDFDAWLPLWQGYQAFYQVSLPEQATRTAFARFLDDSEPMHCTLALRDGKAIGFVHYIFHRSCWTQGDYCYLQDLFVDDTVRGLGVGRKLIEHVYAQATAQQCSRVYWLTQEHNATARKLYDQVADNAGFIQYRKAL